jgi:plasmid stability protein
MGPNYRLLQGVLLMADVKIRNLDDWVLYSHRARAKLAGRSVEEELRHVLTEHAMAVRREWAQELRQLRQKTLEENGGPLPDSTPGIREERDSWG